MRGYVSCKTPVDASADDVWAVLSSHELKKILLGFMKRDFKEIEIVEGDGDSVGSIFRLVITSGIGSASEPTTLLNKIKKIDHDKRLLVIQQIEGGFMDIGFKSYHDVFKVIKISDNACIIKSIVIFEVEENFEATAAMVNTKFTEQVARVVAKYVLELNAKGYDDAYSA